MDSYVLFPAGTSESCRLAGDFLSGAGFLLTDHPSPDITHLLLDISVSDRSDLKELLRMIPKSITVIGGTLDADYLRTYRKIELLKDALFLAKNAAITAECALQTVAPYLTTTFADSPALVLGWGRIGKCLAKLLKGIGCPVTVAARKEGDRAMAEALGYRAVNFSGIAKEIPRHRILFNTVPDGISVNGKFDRCIILDLASPPGLNCSSAIAARGLPGKYAPESAGKLIAESVCRLIKEEIS